MFGGAIVRFSGSLWLGPENLTTLPHFPISSVMSLPKAAGEPGITVPPKSASRALSLESAMSMPTSSTQCMSRRAVTDAARYIKTLGDSGQLTSTGEQRSSAGVTHQIERDEQGRQVLRRKRFSIS